MRPLSFEIIGTNYVSDHYTILLNFENAVQPNFSRMVPSFTSREDIKLSESRGFTVHTSPIQKVVYFFIIFGIALKLHLVKNEKRLCQPVSIHFQNDAIAQQVEHSEKKNCEKA